MSLIAETKSIIINMPSAQLPSPFRIFKGSICESGQVVTCSLIILMYSYLRFLKQQVYTGFSSFTLALGVQELYKSMIGVGTDDSSLIRVITTRAEIDMLYIKGEFSSMSNKTLEHMIAGNTSGNYKHFLLTLVGGA